MAQSASGRGTQGCPLPCCASGECPRHCARGRSRADAARNAWSGSRTLCRRVPELLRLLAGARVAQDHITEHDTARVRFGLQLLLRLAVEKTRTSGTKRTSVTASLFRYSAFISRMASASTTVTSISASKSTCSLASTRSAQVRIRLTHAVFVCNLGLKADIDLMIHHFSLLAAGRKALSCRFCGRLAFALFVFVLCIRLDDALHQLMAHNVLFRSGSTGRCPPHHRARAAPRADRTACRPAGRSG